MKSKLSLPFFVLLIGQMALAQVKIGNNPTVIDPASILELEHPNRAFFLSRVSLTSTTDVTTINVPKAGMLVYNTNAAITGTPANPALLGGVGLYYYDGLRWVGAGDGDWKLTGNAGTVDGTHFLGTTDNVPLNFRVNNQRAGRIEANLSTANTFFGFQSGNSNTGQRNTALGFETLLSNTTGNNNTAQGFEALRENTTGENNVATGAFALDANTTGNNNTAQGFQALLLNETGNRNVAIGVDALGSNTTGGNNTAIGSGSGGMLTTGSFNTLIGANTNVDAANRTNTVAIGGNGNLALGGNNSVRIGNNSTLTIGGQVNWTNYSDKRTKRGFKEDVAGLPFILKLKPLTYRYDVDKQYELMWGKKNEKKYESQYDIEKIRFSGFIAQDVEAIAQQIGYDFSGVDKPQDANGLYGMRYSDFVPSLVKAIQEQQEQIEEQQEQIEKLQKENKELANLIKENAKLQERLERLENALLGQQSASTKK